MPLVAFATSDVSQATLQEFGRDLGPDFDFAVSDSRILLRSAEPPSWIQLFADAPWWIQGLGAYAALYVAELVKEAGKTTWKERAKLVPASFRTGNALGKLTHALLRLGGGADERTKLVLGLPVPDDYFGVRFELVGRGEDIVAAEIALFVRHLPALEVLLAREVIPQGVVGAVNVLVRDDGAIMVAWMSRDLQFREHVLQLKEA